jgi:signal peptidase II
MSEAGTQPAGARGAGQLPWLAASVAVVALDQWSKHLVESQLAPYEVRSLLPVLDVVRARNPGVAFSLFDGGAGWQKWFFSGLAIVVSVVLVGWLAKLPKAARVQGAALALILAGAVGNMLDRLRLGSVVDFILAHWHDHYFWAFNVADAAITVGAVLLVFDALFGHGSQKPQEG